MPNSRSLLHQSGTVPGRRDLMGWRAFVSSPAPTGISVEELTMALAELATEKLADHGPVTAAELHERWHVELCFSFIAHHQTAEMQALRMAAPIFIALGMAIDRIELETCEP